MIDWSIFLANWLIDFSAMKWLLGLRSQVHGSMIIYLALAGVASLASESQAKYRPLPVTKYRRPFDFLDPADEKVKSCQILIK